MFLNVYHCRSIFFIFSFCIFLIKKLFIFIFFQINGRIFLKLIFYLNYHRKFSNENNFLLHLLTSIENLKSSSSIHFLWYVCFHSSYPLRLFLSFCSLSLFFPVFRSQSLSFYPLIYIYEISYIEFTIIHILFLHK